MSGILPEGQFVLSPNLKFKKKKVYKPKSTREKANEETTHSMDISLEADVGSEETESPKNLGSPVIIEALSQCFDSPRTPEAFREDGKSNDDGSSYEIVRIENDLISFEDNAAVVVAQSINPNESPRTNHPQKNKVRKSPFSKKKESWRRSGNKRTTEVQDGGVSKDKTVHEESLENANSDAQGREDVALETEGESCTPRKGKACRWTQDENAPRLYSIRNKVVVVMEEKMRFCFVGKLRVKVMYGAVQVYGTLITSDDSAVEVYSPRGYSSVALECSEKSSSYIEPNVWPLLYGEGIDRNNEDRLVADIDGLRPGMTVVLLTLLKNKLTEFLNIFYPFKLFPRVRNSSCLSWTDPRRAELILQSNLYFGSDGNQGLIVDPSIARDVSETMLNRWRANEWTCTLIAGGKGVGKSTSMRHLINSILPASKMVVLVDVDPGQTECTPPECISYSLIEQPLMGPNFTHLKTPVYQLYIGDVNVSRCLPRYIEGIKMLVDKLKSCPILSHLPIVVNTMGFTDGIGWDIAMYTIKLIRPSLVVQITSQKPRNNFKNVLSSDVINHEKPSWTSWGTNIIDWNEPCDHELRVIRSQAERKNAQVGNETWNMEPYQQRELVMISYLSQILQCPDNYMSYYSALPFSVNNAVPYVAPFSSLSISIPRASTAPSHALSVINGNIVALCGVDPTCDAVCENENSASGPRVLTRSPLCTCYGFGIVRGVDMEREEVFINSPLPGTMMQNVNCLVGCIPVPVTLLQFIGQTNAPYTGGNDVLPTSREPRRGYFRMRYQNSQANG